MVEAATQWISGVLVSSFPAVGVVAMNSVEGTTELGRKALIVAMELALPVLAVGLAVGLLVSLFQAVTQIQEQTLSFIPKILAMAATVFLLLPWFLDIMTTYMVETCQQMLMFGSP